MTQPTLVETSKTGRKQAVESRQPIGSDNVFIAAMATTVPAITFFAPSSILCPARSHIFFRRRHLIFRTNATFSKLASLGPWTDMRTFSKKAAGQVDRTFLDEAVFLDETPISAHSDHFYRAAN